jgi:putative oxidoreductase
MENLTAAQWQLFLIRVYLGLDIIPHFAEKLFEGPAHRAEVVKAFIDLGVSAPVLMVLLAGLVEFSIFIGFTVGLMTRIAAAGGALYLFITTALGHHFSNGFIWVTSGGGWEFPVMWAFLCLSFVITGGGPWSVDAWMRKKSGWIVFK